MTCSCKLQVQKSLVLSCLYAQGDELSASYGICKSTDTNKSSRQICPFSTLFCQTAFMKHPSSHRNHPGGPRQSLNLVAAYFIREAWKDDRPALPQGHSRAHARAPC